METLDKKGALKIPAINQYLAHKMADLGSNNYVAFREALVECLTHILSPELQLRSKAEEKVKLLEVTEGNLSKPYHL